jgi:type IV secretion system protein VirB10
VLAGAIGLVSAGVLGWALWKGANPPPEPVKEKLPASLAASVPYSPPQMVIPRQAPPLLQATPVHYPPPLPAIPSVQPPAPAPPPQPPTAPAVHLAGIQPAAPPKPYRLTYSDPPPPPGHAAGGPGAAGADGSSKISYAAMGLDGVKAGLLGDQTFLLLPGILPCVMDTAVNSTFAGPVQCHLDADVKPHGVVLLDRGSRIHGWYNNQVQTGQARLFVQADWVEDPASGCFVKFDNAPVADAIGQAGVPGSVDEHYMQRFGAAVLLTLGQGGESLAQAAVSKGNNTYLNFNGGSNGVDTIASAILRKQIDIPPTVTVNQGSRIAVFVTKPLDFSPCYDLKTKG